MDYIGTNRPAETDTDTDNTDKCSVLGLVQFTIHSSFRPQIRPGFGPRVGPRVWQRVSTTVIDMVLHMGSHLDFRWFPFIVMVFRSFLGFLL